MDEYEASAKAANDASEVAKKDNKKDLHSRAASLHRIAAEQAKMAGKSEESTMHLTKADKHGYAMQACMNGKEAKAFSEKLHELSAARLEKNGAIEASIADGGISLNDLQQGIREACSEIELLNKPAEGNKNAVSSGCWVADVVAPKAEGEPWEAIIQAADGKLYCASFAISDNHEVSLVGDPKEVQRTTDYKYVGDMEEMARQAVTEGGLEAGEFRGNQHKTPQDIADEHTAAANLATRKANAASKKASDKPSFEAAASLQSAAALAHEAAAEKHESAGNEDDSEDHKAKAAKCKAKAAEHGGAMEALQTRNAALDCARTDANKLRSVLQPIEDGIIMYMPGGVHTITPSQNGRPVTVTVEVNEAAAGKLEKQRKALEAAGKKPFFSVQHETEIAAFWPAKFFWDKRLDATGSLVEGVWAEGEWTKSGKEAVEGKDFRTFSPTFFVDAVRNDPDRPVQIICNDEARANMGALENDPAFQSLSPLWARNAGAPGTNTGDQMEKTETVAELQARNKQLEQKVAELKAKDDAVSKAELRATQAEQREIQAQIKLTEANEKSVALEASEKKRKEEDAESAVQRMVAAGTIPVRDTELQAEYKTKFTNDPTLIRLMAGNGNGRSNGLNGGRMTPNPNGLAIEDETIGGGHDTAKALKKYAQLMAQNANIDWRDPMRRMDSYIEKGRLALEAAALFKTDLLPRAGEWEHIPVTELGKRIGLKASGRVADNGQRIELSAADYSNDNAPSNVLGVLSGTLVLQRTLPMFAYKFPEFLNLYTDFSDTPGLLNQTELTRIVLQPAVQKYDATTDGTGRPKGWSTVSPARTTDVPLTLTDYVAVPIVFGQNQLGTTTRRLFDEQSVLAIKALAGYFVGLLCDLFTSAKYNAYAVAGANGIVAGGPTYPTYARSLAEFSMGDLDALDAIFTNGKVPEEDRGIMLAPSYYSKLRGDPRLNFMYAASAKDAGAGAGEFLTEARLPKLSGFGPYKAPYLPAGTPVAAPTTNNLIGFAFQKAAAVLKSRLPQDFTQALGVMIPGSVTTITDPDTKISIMLVQYISLQGGWAEWRPEVILGVGAGDSRAGLCLTSA